MPAAQRRTAAWKMSVPTIFAAVSGKRSRSISPKNVPLPTEVRPSTKPPERPMANARKRSRLRSRYGRSSGGPRWTTGLTAKTSPPPMRAPPRVAGGEARPHRQADVEVEHEHEHRGHERAAAHTGEPDEQADQKPGE